MSDFLTRLAQRQLGKIATIEPRLSGVYSPVETAFGEPGFGTEQPPDMEVERSNFPMSRQSSKWAPFDPPVVSAEPTTGTPRAEQRWPIVENRQTTERPLRDPADSGAEKLPWTSGGQFSADVQPRVSEKLPVEHRSIDLSSETQRRLRANEPTAVEKPRFVDSEARAPARLVDPIASNDVALPQPMRGLRERTAVARRAKHFEERVRDGAEPPVHVTIGRIEVSAVTASAPPKRASTAHKPSMSLEDYLARRQRRDR